MESMEGESGSEVGARSRLLAQVRALCQSVCGHRGERVVASPSKLRGFF